MTDTAETVRVLREARALIAEPESWCQGGSGRRVANGVVVARCGSQAVWEVDCRPDVALPAIHGLQRTADVWLFSEWNDAARRTHAEVLDAFDRTIARLEAEG